MRTAATVHSSWSTQRLYSRLTISAASWVLSLSTSGSAWASCCRLEVHSAQSCPATRRASSRASASSVTCSYA
jgi:hypothetical protein